MHNSTAIAVDKYNICVGDISFIIIIYNKISKKVLFYDILCYNIKKGRKMSQTNEEIDYKDEFLEIFYDNIERDGSDKLLEWLERSDFFTAPASTNRHSAFKGGLCMHSVLVYKRFVKLLENEYGKTWEKQFSKESAAIVALLHDVCKVDCYQESFKNVKDENGVWQKVPCYKFEEALPYGHGEKSVYIISSFMKLSREESMAINWHMGNADSRVKGGFYGLSSVFYAFPTALLFHIADMQATFLDETS